MQKCIAAQAMGDYQLTTDNEYDKGGKALSLNDLVLTPSGFVRMGDIELGMKVNRPYGGTATVIGVHPQGKKQLYKVTTSDGITVKCCDEHLWDVEIGKEHRVITTTEIRQLLKSKHRIAIPICEMQEFGEKYTGMIHPYIIGALLGDGGMTQRITYTTSDEFVVNKIRQLLPGDAKIEPMPSAKYGYSVTNRLHKDFGKPYSPMLDEIRRLGMNCRSDKKRVPKEVMYADMETRIQCVQGMMDSDGYVDSRGHCSFSVCNKELAEDFMFMIRSLGAKARLTSRIKSCVYKGERKYATSWNVTFNSGCNNHLFVTLPRQLERIKYTHIQPRYIISIEEVGTEEAQCITLDSSDGLFITNDFLVTHNSFCMSVWLVSACLRFEGVRAVVARKTLKSLKESTWNTICAVVKRWGLKEDVHYRINNVAGTMRFWNDSIIIMLDMADQPSDPNFERFGSMEATIAAVDEVSEISQKAIEVLFSRLRWKTHETFKVSKMLLTTNPTTNWVRSRFVQDD
ncbi:MAG: phage terminase large subunit, partial [Rikenellaceae bacterium]